MTNPVKPKPGRISTILELLLISSILSGAGLVYVETRGDLRWADRTSTEEAITQLTLMADRSEAHRMDTDVHMPQAQKDDRYMTRVEIDSALNHLTAELSYLRDEMRESRRDTEKMFREILEKLP